MMIARWNSDSCTIIIHMIEKKAMQDPGAPADIREWARSRGIDIAARGRIPEPVVELHRAQPSIVREWARDRGIGVASRGPLPVEVLESYLARPDAVRAWARRKGIPVAARGRISDDVVESYLAPYRQLMNKAG